MDYDQLIDFVSTSLDCERFYDGNVICVRSSYNLNRTLENNSFSILSSVTEEFTQYGEFDPISLSVAKFVYTTHPIVKEVRSGWVGSFFNKVPAYRQIDCGSSGVQVRYILDRPKKTQIPAEGVEGIVEPPVLEILKSIHSEFDKWTRTFNPNSLSQLGGYSSHALSYPGMEDIEFTLSSATGNISPHDSPFTGEEIKWMKTVFDYKMDERHKADMADKRKRYTKVFSK